MNNNIIKGQVFIIPNSLAGWGNEWNDSILNRTHKVINIPKGEKYVNIWAFSPGDENSNWCCHYEMPGGDNFPSYLPVEIFEGKAEGDTITLETKWGTVELTLKQSGTRYGSYGKFESVLNRLIAL